MIDELSIIIPTLNEAEYLPALLDSIARQTYKGSLQVIVVDARSEDRTVYLAESFKNRIPELSIFSTERNAGHQRNVGARHARYKYLLFLDADVVLPDKTLERLSQKIRMDKQFIAGVMHTAGRGKVLDRLFFRCLYLLIFLSWRSGSPPSVGDFILTTRQNHLKIGGFVEGAIMGEDIDYGARSARAGAERLYYFWPQVAGSVRRLRQLGKWRLLVIWARAFRYVRKHGPIFPNQGFDYPSNNSRTF